MRHFKQKISYVQVFVDDKKPRICCTLNDIGTGLGYHSAIPQFFLIICIPKNTHKCSLGLPRY